MLFRVGAMKKRQMFGWGSLVVLLLCGFLGLACSKMPEGRGAPSDNFTKPERDFGDEVYKLILREAAIHPTHSKQRVSSIENLNTSWNVKNTINAMVPEAALSDVEAFMRKLLPMYDDSTISNLTKEIAGIALKAAQDKSLLGALVAMNKRVGLTPPVEKGTESLMARVLSFPKNRELLQTLTQWFLQRDGFTSDGLSLNPNEPTLMEKLLGALSEWMREQEPGAANSEPSFLLDLLLQQDERLDLKIGPYCAVMFDGNGDPILTTDGKQAQAPVPPPFPSDTKRVGNCKESILVAGKPLYEVRDITRSILGSVLWDMRKLILRDLPLKGNKLPFPFNMTTGIRPLLGEKSVKGRYTTNSPIISMLRASVDLLKGPKLYKVIRLLAVIAEKEEPELAALLSMLDELSAIADRNPSNLHKNHSLMDDMLPFIQELVQTPGMLEDLLKVFQTPGLVDKVKASSLLLFKFAKQKISVDEYLKNKQNNTIFLKKVDTSQPDIPGNISLFQRVLHLLADVNRHSYKSRIKALGGINIPFIEMRIDNLALLYLRAVVGGLEIWETIYVNGSKIKDGILKDQLRNALPLMGLSETPNPEELGIFINRELKFKDVPLLGPIKLDLFLDPIIGREGYEVRKHQGDALLAGLASGLIGADGGALRPVAKVFAKYKKLERFLDLLGVLNRHWPSAQNTAKDASGKAVFPTPRTNVRSLEPMLIETIETTELLDKLPTVGKILLETRLKGPNSERGYPALRDFLEFVLGKMGTAYKQTNLGKLFEQFDAMDKALDGPANKSARDAWTDAVDALSDLFLKVEGKGSQARFANRRVPVVLTLVLNRAADEVEALALKGKWAPKVNEVQKDMEELLTDPIVPVLLDFLDDMVKDRPLLELTTELIVHVLPDPAKEPKQFGEALVLITSLLAPTPDNIRVPVLKFLGRVLEEHRPMMTRVMAFIDRTFPLDPTDQFLQLMRRSVAKHPTLDESLMGFVPALVRSMYRSKPGANTELNAVDYQSIFTQLSKYLTDKEHGMEKLYEVIKNRNGQPTSKK